MSFAESIFPLTGAPNLSNEYSFMYRPGRVATRSSFLLLERRNEQITNGVKQVLNINGGTILAGYILHKLGVGMEFTISVFMGNDNPFNVLWTLMTARLFARTRL
jgi:hypothetical protein